MLYLGEIVYGFVQAMVPYTTTFSYHLKYSGEVYSHFSRLKGLISPPHLFLVLPLHLRYYFQRGTELDS